MPSDFCPRCERIKLGVSRPSDFKHLATPPALLYHGTAGENLTSIMEDGLTPGNSERCVTPGYEEHVSGWVSTVDKQSEAAMFACRAHFGTIAGDAINGAFIQRRDRVDAWGTVVLEINAPWAEMLGVKWQFRPALENGLGHEWATHQRIPRDAIIGARWTHPVLLPNGKTKHVSEELDKTELYVLAREGPSGLEKFRREVAEEIAADRASRGLPPAA